MTPDHLSRVAKCYLGLIPLLQLSEGELAPVRNGTALEHALWMCEQIIKLAANAHTVDKGFRWLGFVQGVLWHADICSIDEMRDHNKSESDLFKAAYWRLGPLVVQRIFSASVK